jgi:hypothetical protein
VHAFFQFVQSIGYYIQYIVQLGWHTDAFEQLGKSAQGSISRNFFFRPKKTFRINFCPQILGQISIKNNIRV